MFLVWWIFSCYGRLRRVLKRETFQMSKKRPGSLRSLVFLLCAEHFVFCLSGMLSSDDLLFLLEACPVLLVIRTCLDLSCAREGDSGKLRANQLIDQYAE